MSKDDRTYYRCRMTTELELAAQATQTEVIVAHSQLATAYLERLSVGDVERRTVDA